MQVDFVKGHCGFDAVTLLPAGQIPPARELETALRILAPPFDGGLEVGFLGPGNRADEIRLRMIDSTTRTWIPMCGGMSQVIGKALVETFFRERFKVDVSRAHQELQLCTPAGVVRVLVEIDGRQAVRVTSVMDAFASYLYGSGVEPVTVDGCRVLRLGDYCVFELGELERAHPGLDFTRRDAGPSLEVVNRILARFAERYSAGGGVVGMMYDALPEGPGDYRVYPRFYSPDLAAARLAYEFQCGTGAVAVSVALAMRGLLLPEAHGSVVFEWGSQRSTPDPYGIRTSRLEYETIAGRLVRVSFTHSVVEILAEGRITLPDYEPARAW
jgi:hypothetical protein